MVSSKLPQLSQPQATVLALWSYGIVMTRSCGRRTVSSFLALLLGQKLVTVEQRLQEWCYEAQAKAGVKRGVKRQAVEVSSCFGPLLKWVASLWSGSNLALALDATSLKDRLVVLSVSVLYRGCAIPVAWVVLPGNQPASWRPHWLRLLRQLRPAIPADWTVLVLADRGLYAPWLFRRIVRLGWHPFLRVNRGAKFRPTGQVRWSWLSDLVGPVGGRWRGEGTAFASASRRLNCTLLAWWGEGHQEAWFVLTDLAADRCDANWYGLRTWCEQGFKCLKRGGWQWQQTRMTDPARAARLWLAMAVASLWVISVGAEVELAPPADQPDLPDLRALLGLPARRTRPIRLFRLGWLWLLVQLVKAQPLPLPRRLIPEPWPEVPALFLKPSLFQEAPACVAI